MNWKRPRPGLYVAGPYTVQKIADGWEATGPGVEGITDHREQAGALCEAAAKARDPKMCEPVIGDVVMTNGGRHGRLHSAIGKGYSIHSPRGRKLFLFRNEFEVMVS